VSRVSSLLLVADALRALRTTEIDRSSDVVVAAEDGDGVRTSSDAWNVTGVDHHARRQVEMVRIGFAELTFGSAMVIIISFV